MHHRPGEPAPGRSGRLALETGIATRTYGTDSHPHPDWHRLHELGLC